MSRLLVLITALVLVTVLVPALQAKDQAANEADNQTAREASDVEQSAAKQSNAFAIDLYRQLMAGDGNLFFSPASISTALAMTYAGSAGETRAEMGRVLHLGDSTTSGVGFGALSRMMNASDRDYTLRMANRLWGAKSYPFLPEFLSVSNRDFGADLVNLDFGQADRARGEINSWVASATNDKIQDLIPAGALNDATRLVLTNAVYFQAAWMETFDKSLTRPSPFHRGGDAGDVEVPMMVMKAKMFAYGAADGMQVLELPYLGRDLSFIAVLPTEVGLDALEGKLTHENLEKWLSLLAPRRVVVGLPRFKTTSQLGLAGTLAAMGMRQAFSRHEADFSRMTSVEGLYINNVIHKAFIDLNEDGTEAAAATAVTMFAASAPSTDEPVRFFADRPFIYMIRDKNTHAILFLGRLTDPSA